MEKKYKFGKITEYMKILIVKPSSFGDIIQANPVLTAIKSAWPGSTVDWLVFKQWKEIIEMFPLVDNIREWDRCGGLKAFSSVLKECNKQKYDLVIDLQGLMRTALLVKLMDAKKKIGVSGMKELSWLLVKEPYKRNKEENAVSRNLKSVSYLTGVQYTPKFGIISEKLPSDKREEFGLSEEDIVVAFVPFSRGKTKTWDSRNYVELAKKIKEEDKNIKILILGSAKDYGKIKSKDICDICGKTNIKELAGVLQRCKFVVGADTGAMHLANGLGIKNVFIFGGSDINETAPYGIYSKVVSAYLSCSPCRGKCKFNTEKCLQQITPEAVFGNIKEWIK